MKKNRNIEHFIRRIDDIFFHDSDRKLIFSVFLIVFSWTLFVGILVQRILLIYVFPNMNAGHGLLTGTDYLKFHKIAVRLANKISVEGWEKWILRPEGQMVSGIAAIFYTLITTEPWTLLPWNAFLHALSAVILFCIFNLLFKNKKYSLIAVLPFAFFPSSFGWTIMLHNENYIVPGVMLVVYSLTLFFYGSKIKISRFVFILLMNSVGLAIIYQSRTSAAQAMAGVNLLFLVLFTGKKVIETCFNKRKSQIKLGVRIVLIILLIIIQIEALLGLSGIKLNQPTSYHVKSDQRASIEITWTRSVWIPNIIDQKLEQMVRMRKTQLSLFSKGATNIDEEVNFNKAIDVISYIPRSLQIGFLAPFPSHWISSGPKVTSRFQRLESAFEMVISYIALFGLPAALYSNRKSFSFWYLMCMLIGMVIVYTISMPNIGTLYRFRYPFYTPLIGIGLTTWIKRFNKNRMR